jgi:hypothetical protein
VEPGTKQSPSVRSDGFAAEDPVLSYVFRCFVEAGFNAADAQRLALARTDHHFVEERLLDRGCSLELALKIAL